ncbi:MAG TPA: hypothetical protein VI636_09440 [Candidatus Angelobacter sp.]
MSSKQISKGQIKRLQTLWGKYARHEMVKNSRDERLRWANSVLSHRTSPRTSPISSFAELTGSEASELIDLLQSDLAIPETHPNIRPSRYSRRYRDRDSARAAGTEGRKGTLSKVTLATAEDLALINEQLKHMGWNRTRLDAFLQSPSSPLSNRSNPTLRTMADVNRVLWALKGIAKATAPTPATGAQA